MERTEAQDRVHCVPSPLELELEHRVSETEFVLLCSRFSYATETSLARGNRRLASTCTAPTKIIMQMQESIGNHKIYY